MKQKIRTIDIQAKEWFDKTYGNSYFSAIVTINYGMDDEITVPLHFQYGYGDTYRHIAFRELQKRDLIQLDENEVFWNYCDKNNIVLRCSKQERCLKREVVRFTA